MYWTDRKLSCKNNVHYWPTKFGLFHHDNEPARFFAVLIVKLMELQFQASSDYYLFPISIKMAGRKDILFKRTYNLGNECLIWIGPMFIFGRDHQIKVTFEKMYQS